MATATDVAELLATHPKPSEVDRKTLGQNAVVGRRSRMSPEPYR